ncbi:unnamed protein product [Cylicocyclus nassatus]|uniref:Uncharacterized protein n=1 Tax=Cylicocyclus nassatus TaxID=53992 RepID=A0AA36GS20_CYLNA|nr:unnamed protein product [Cylicocyclus nassatus]
MGDDGRQSPQDTYDLHKEDVFAEEMAPAQPESIRLDRRDLRSILDAIRGTDSRLSEFLESVKPKEESTLRKRKAALPPPFRKREAAWSPASRSFQPTMDSKRISKEVACADRSTPRRIARITGSTENWTEERESVGPVDKKVTGGETARKENTHPAFMQSTSLGPISLRQEISSLKRSEVPRTRDLAASGRNPRTNVEKFVTGCLD